jgi:hypothetical protein
VAVCLKLRISPLISSAVDIASIIIALSVSCYKHALEQRVKITYPRLNTSSFGNPNTSLTGTSGQSITSTRLHGNGPAAQLQ